MTRQDKRSQPDDAEPGCELNDISPDQNMAHTARPQAARAKPRFSEAEIAQFLRLEQSGVPLSGLCARYGFTHAEFFRWKARRKTTSEEPAHADELAALRAENALLRELVAMLLGNARRERGSGDRHGASPDHASEAGSAEVGRELP